MSTSRYTDLPYYRYTEVFDKPGEISCDGGHPGGLGARVVCQART